MPSPVLLAIERSRADGLHPSSIRIYDLADGSGTSGELRITFDDLDGGKPQEELDRPLPAGVACRIIKRVPDMIERVSGTQAEWISWIREVARIGGAPDCAIFEPCDPLAALEQEASLWSILTKPVRWLTPETRAGVNYNPDS